MMIPIQERQVLQRVRQLRKAVADLEAGLEALGARLDHRLDNLQRLCFHLRDSKLDKDAVVDQVLEQLRRVRR